MPLWDIRAVDGLSGRLGRGLSHAQLSDEPHRSGQRHTTHRLGPDNRSPAIGYISDKMNNRKIPFICAGLVYLGTWAVMAYWPGGKPSPAFFPAFVFPHGFFRLGLYPHLGHGQGGEFALAGGQRHGLQPIMGGFLGAAILQPLFGFMLDPEVAGTKYRGGADLFPGGLSHGLHAGDSLCLLEPVFRTFGQVAQAGDWGFIV